MTDEELMTHRGGCHCGAVRFEVDAAADAVAHACNCSICAKTGFQHLIVPAAQFRLLTDESALQTYRFNSGVARHLFCTTCGVKSFYVPRSNPDGVSVNVRCLDPETTGGLRLEAFDGRNWEANAAALRHLSEDRD